MEIRSRDARLLAVVLAVAAGTLVGPTGAFAQG
jgi:hypothetical protein